MTTVAQIIEDAFFEAGLTTELQHGTPTQTRRAMTTFAGVVQFMYGTDVGELLQPWPLGNFGRSTQSRMSLSEQQLRYPMQNSRLIAVNENALTVNLPVNPSDGARMGIVDPFGRLSTAPITLDGNGRTISGEPTVVIDTDGDSSVWLYRGDTGNWAIVSPLTISDEMPFPTEYDEMFKIMLAMRLNPVYGRNLSSVQAMFLKEYRQQFAARYVQSAPLEINPELSFPTLQSYDNFAGAWFSNGGTTDYFNLGGFYGGGIY